MPDFTNAAATAWWMSKRAYLFDDVGIDGMKTDGGEMIFGRKPPSPTAARATRCTTRYTNAYTGAYGAYVPARRAEHGVLFSRGGTAGAQANSIYWAGDQASTFSAFQQAMRAGLSARRIRVSRSGPGTWPASPGRFPAASSTCGRRPSRRSRRSCSTTPRSRTRARPKPGRPGMSRPARATRTVIPTFRKFANIRMNLIPYIYTEAKNARRPGLPMMQTMRMAFPADATAAPLDMQYMFGRQLLVAPITTQGPPR